MPKFFHNHADPDASRPEQPSPVGEGGEGVGLPRGEGGAAAPATVTGEGWVPRK